MSDFAEEDVAPLGKSGEARAACFKGFPGIWDPGRAIIGRGTLFMVVEEVKGNVVPKGVRSNNWCWLSVRWATRGCTCISCKQRDERRFRPSFEAV
jgi:hypothetical protein